MNRSELGIKYGQGTGIEIGAGHSPWPIPGAVKFVDRYTRSELLAHFPEETRAAIPETDIVANGFHLHPHDIGGRVNFIVSSHCLEHTYNPVDALNSWLNCVKPGGYVFGAVPNKDHTFDKPRQLTYWQDLNGPDVLLFRRLQYWEWFALIDKLGGDDLAARVQAAETNDEHIHFPVWDAPTFQNFISIYAQHHTDIRSSEVISAGHEMFFVIKKK